MIRGERPRKREKRGKEREGEREKTGSGQLTLGVRISLKYKNNDLTGRSEISKGEKKWW